MSPRILYASGSIGLGHVTRDLAVAREIRSIEPDSEIVWLAASPASDLLQRSGEVLAPEHSEYRCETELAESVGRGGRLNLTQYVYRALGSWLSNARVFGRAASAGYDILIGNETYEIVVAYVLGLDVLPRIPYVMMYDFYGMDLATTGIFERLGAWGLNFVWAQEGRVTSRPGNRALFFGELEDIPDRTFGLFLPNRRAYAADHVDFVGYALPFAEDDIADRSALRAHLGYGPEPLVVCSIGGTAVGRDLLELCAEAYTLVRSRIRICGWFSCAAPESIRRTSPRLPGWSAWAWWTTYGSTLRCVTWRSCRAVEPPRSNSKRSEGRSCAFRSRGNPSKR